MLTRSFHSLRGTMISSLKGPTSSLKSILSSKILSEGPIPFSTYMDLCLSHPEFGYYNGSSIFGKSGDFITSPEISQLFGESLGIWCCTLYNALTPPKWHIVELGPGTGALAVDILRTLRSLNCSNGLSLHFVDTSTSLKKIQQQSILRACNGQLQHEKYRGVERYFDKDFSAYWYSSLAEMTNVYLQEYKSQPVIVIGHEIFDALPVHIFEYTDKVGWCERMVDTTALEQFEMVLSNGANENVKKVLKPEKLFKRGVIHNLKEGDTIEISPASLTLMGDICELIKHGPSCCLLVDYGEERAFSNSIRVGYM